MAIISVIIPAYNAEKTIRQTIDSVLNQIFQNFEIIVINDGSTDLTLDIVSGINDPRIKIFSYPNSGAAVSRNRGFDVAKGEYIALLDADDLWTSDKLEAQYNALKSHPQASVAYSWTDYIDESGNFLKLGRHLTFNGDVYPELLVQNFLENGSNPLIHRESFAEVGGFDQSLLGGQDRDLYIRLAAHYHFVAVPLVQVFYRMSPNSISSQILRQEKQCVAVIEKAFLQAPPSLQHLKKQSLAKIYKYFIDRALQGYPSPEKGRATIGFLFNYIRYDSSALQQWRFCLIILFKSLIIALFPPSIAKKILSTLKKIV
ncbi:putative glycosyl transferase [Planktothrix agardhii CCAP 1459/11A]|uniref:Putative glycosyl transferase n=1 Tax=Planktothrix agardhii CCAP 1459/11A TaxID=282420 RepID=A0A4P5ZF65_PLAAG|nr:glycosyltransferase [Planktothrix agardhii]GDZ94043.1 putative glycosyl transferase [Planktothrix agardhii CCAP 1459/11A]CAH2573000.1 putative glycosyltransferase RBE_0706 [Planktothrix rubescens]